MANKYYVTTPIYYVNDIPHIGHAYTTLAADVLARYHRQKGDDVFFLTGTDEHGAKIAQAAQEKGLEPKEYSDQVVPQFIDSWKLLNINNDYFIRTTDPNHEKVASEVLQKVYDNGFIYEDTYEGLYCVGCEKFLTESDLVDGKCPFHPNKEPVHQKEKNYFFKLSYFEKELTQLFESGEVKIGPESRKNEVLGKLKLGLQDVSISRAGVSWGIPVPWDNTQTIYVWVEALCNYYTATQFLEGKNKFWPADLHLVGKDILWFHTVIWCALLKAAGIERPKQVFAHGFFTVDGQKMSKSLGNVISPQALIDRYGVDGARYLLLSAFPFGDDGDFSFDKLDTKFNSDLANGLGNLVSRVSKLCEGITISENLTVNKLITDIPTTSGKVKTLYSQAIENNKFDEALKLIKDDIAVIDKYIGEEQPWKLEKEELVEVIQVAVDAIRYLNQKISPFLPETSEKIEAQFKGPKIASSSPLFPRIG